MTINFLNNKCTAYFSCYSRGWTGDATLSRPSWVFCPVVGSTVLPQAGRGGDRATGAHSLTGIVLMADISASTHS